MKVELTQDDIAWLIMALRNHEEKCESFKNDILHRFYKDVVSLTRDRMVEVKDTIESKCNEVSIKLTLIEDKLRKAFEDTNAD